MASTGIQVKGLKETIRSLEKFGVEIADLKAAFKRIGNMVVEEAQTMAPKKSGKLAMSIKSSNTKNKSIVRAGGAKLPYAGVIHYGGYHGIEPHPFLTDAMGHKQGDIIGTFEKEIHSLVKSLDLD